MRSARMDRGDRAPPSTGVCSGVAGLLVEAGVIDAADDADEHAIAWHAFFWDPWFLLWGVAVTVAMWRSRPRASDEHSR